MKWDDRCVLDQLQKTLKWFISDAWNDMTACVANLQMPAKKFRYSFEVRTMSYNSEKDTVGIKVVRRSILYCQSSCHMRCSFQSHEDSKLSSDYQAALPQEKKAYENWVVKWYQVNCFWNNTQSCVSIVFGLFQLPLRTGKWHYICSRNRDKWINTERCVHLSNQDNVITSNVIRVLYHSTAALWKAKSK